MTEPDLVLYLTLNPCLAHRVDTQALCGRLLRRLRADHPRASVSVRVGDRDRLPTRCMAWRVGCGMDRDLERAAVRLAEAAVTEMMAERSAAGVAA